jgi:hypothetical protein
MNCTYLRLHLVKAAVLLKDSFNEMAEIDKFVFLMNEGRFIMFYHLHCVICITGERCFYVAARLKYVCSVNISYVRIFYHVCIYRHIHDM